MVKRSWVKCVTLHELVCFDGPRSLRQHDIHYVNISRRLMFGLASSNMPIKEKHTVARLRLNTADCSPSRLSQAKSKRMQKGNTKKQSSSIFKILKTKKKKTHPSLNSQSLSNNMSSRLELELWSLTAGYLLSCTVHSLFVKQKEINRKVVVLLSQSSNHLSGQGKNCRCLASVTVHGVNYAI